jgi:hypothetical protein
MTSDLANDLWYVIDADDRLVKVSEGYFDFAVENRLPHAGGAVGEPLWGFVSGSGVREVQRTLIRRIRRTGGTVVLPFRCDGPSVQRELMLTVGPGGGEGWIVFSTRSAAEQHRERQPFLDRTVPRKPRLIPRCSWCGRIGDAGTWVELEEASSDLHLFDVDSMPGIDHDLCNRCVLVLAQA